MEKELSHIDMDCPICLQKVHHPTRLPCNHIFCFLCVKGIAIQSKKCAMCRTPIPHDYLDHPVLMEKLTLDTSDDNSTEYQWYYEGRNGWWRYDEQSNEELEEAWSEGATQCRLLLAGALYVVDFQSMIQTRRNDPTRRRKVKRDAPSLPTKGIAGIKIIDESKSDPEPNTSTSEESHNEDQVLIVSSSNSNDEEIDSIIGNIGALDLENSQYNDEE